MPPTKDGGKKPPGKLDKRLEDDALFKEIGGQLDGNFDYGQWQRTGGKLPVALSAGKSSQSTRIKQATIPEKTAPGFAGFAVASSPGTWKAPAQKKTKDPDHSCRHNSYKEKRQSINAAYEVALAKQKAEQIKVLQLRIRARRQTIGEYRKRKAELLLANLELKDGIIDDEKLAHEEVKKLLRQYEKYRGGINTLNDRFVDDLAEAKESYFATKEQVNADLSALQEKVDAMDARLKEKQNEMHVLVNYKDQEYPVKALRITDLQREIADLKLTHEDEESELNAIVEAEINKFKKAESERKENITGKATEAAIKRMHPSLKDMAMQNFVMVKEIEFHSNEIDSIKEQNKSLKHEVQDLIKDPKTSIRKQMFPEFFPTLEKCTPDMDVVLDIPTQKWLPI